MEKYGGQIRFLFIIPKTKLKSKRTLKMEAKVVPKFAGTNFVRSTKFCQPAKNSDKLDEKDFIQFRSKFLGNMKTPRRVSES